MPVRNGRKINTRLTDKEVRQLRIIALEQGKTLTDLVTEILRSYLAYISGGEEVEEE